MFLPFIKSVSPRYHHGGWGAQLCLAAEPARTFRNVPELAVSSGSPHRDASAALPAPGQGAAALLNDIASSNVCFPVEHSEQNVSGWTCSLRLLKKNVAWNGYLRSEKGLWGKKMLTKTVETWTFYCDVSSHKTLCIIVVQQNLPIWLELLKEDMSVWFLHREKPFFFSNIFLRLHFLFTNHSSRKSQFSFSFYFRSTSEFFKRNNLKAKRKYSKLNVYF